MNILALFFFAFFLSANPLPVCAAPATPADYTELARDISLSAYVPAEKQYGAIHSQNKGSIRLEAYIPFINKGDPAYAKILLEDREALKALSNNSGIKAKALALRDLYSLMDKDWKIAQHNTLNKALVWRIGEGKTLSLLGIGPEPEKLINWLKKYIARYIAPETAKQNIYVVNQAIRNWEVVFGTATSSIQFSWQGAPITISAQQWRAMPLLKRNAALKQIALYSAQANNDPRFYAYVEEYLDIIAVNNEQAIRVKKAMESDILTEEQKKMLANERSYADKAYLLNKFFDGTKVGYDSDIRLGINSSRASMPSEIFSAQAKQLLAPMLKTSVANELKGTLAGERVLDGGLKIDIAYCDLGYSELKPDGTIIIDEATIQQYMRLKGYTADSVISNKQQLAELAKYISPIVVYESAHRSQAKWAKAKGVYKPHTQEDEIDAMSLESLYTAEKMQKDEAFHNLFIGIEDYSKYAAKRLSNAAAYTQGKKIFADNIRLDSASLLSLDGARANVLSAINAELCRRAKLSAKERSEEFPFINYEEAVLMSPEQISASIGDIEEGALARMKSSLNANLYAEYNKAALSSTRREYNKLISLPNSESASAGASAVPLP